MKILYILICLFITTFSFPMKESNNTQKSTSCGLFCCFKKSKTTNDGIQEIPKIESEPTPADRFSILLTNLPAYHGGKTSIIPSRSGKIKMPLERSNPKSSIIDQNFEAPPPAPSNSNNHTSKIQRN